MEVRLILSSICAIFLFGCANPAPIEVQPQEMFVPKSSETPREVILRNFVLLNVCKQIYYEDRNLYNETIINSIIKAYDEKLNISRGEYIKTRLMYKLALKQGLYYNNKPLCDNIVRKYIMEI